MTWLYIIIALCLPRRGRKARQILWLHLTHSARWRLGSALLMLILLFWLPISFVGDVVWPKPQPNDPALTPIIGHVAVGAAPGIPESYTNANITVSATRCITTAVQGVGTINAGHFINK